MEGNVQDTSKGPSEDLKVPSKDTDTPSLATSKPKITSVKATAKVKDPKNVAQGKRLAETSKEGKEKKARERIQAEMDEKSWKVDYGMVFVILGILVAVGAVWYASGNTTVSKPTGNLEVSKPKEVIRHTLESLD